jgi:hypothetical protein
MTMATGHPKVTEAHIESLIVDEDYRIMGETLTVCSLTLRNGYTVVGTSACVYPENFDADVGRKIARGKATSKIWSLEGYLLAQRRHEASQDAGGV